MMVGRRYTFGTVRAFSQLMIDHSSVPKSFPVSFRVSFKSSRRFLMCSPKVRGSKLDSFLFKALRQTGTNGKKATKPCPCGYLGHSSGKCRCTPDQIARYRGKISGPLLDRIDIQIEVPALSETELVGESSGETSTAIRERVERSRARQIGRQKKSNARLSPKEVEKLCVPDRDGEELLKRAINRLNLSARAYHRVLKVARSIADLADSDTIVAAHIAEAVQYRRLDRIG
jgi:Magnesium chelatase, subunit ChlI C-terminal/Magnesium chelatase, subunit ChlI